VVLHRQCMVLAALDTRRAKASLGDLATGG
jgi:hypothetical protein